tara:strand:- start:145 stop:1170 length:1026 start_codon:yes stop_codon:yes gene_type:complete
MADTEISEAPADSGAETTTQGITTLEELTASFVEKVEEAEPSQESEAEAGPETTTADAETDQEDVLLQSTESEESEEEETEEIAEEEESTEESGDNEPQSKAVGKLLKQVNRLTARSKSSEELVETLKSEIASLKSNPQTQSESSQPALEEVNDFESLETLRKEALAAKRWSLQHIGKDFIEVDGKEYADEDIRNILTQAEDYLTEKIPERAQYLQSAAQWQQDTIKTHPWISETVDTDQAEERRSVLGQIKSQYSDILKSLPNGDFIAATLVRGVEAIKQDQAAKSAKPKSKRVAKAPPSSMGDSSPPVQTSASRKTANKQKILERKILSANDLAAFLAD